MKLRYLSTLLCITTLLFMFGCNKPEHINNIFDSEPDFVGQYIQEQDVQHIGQALNSVKDNTPVQWENSETKYQYSLTIFTTKVEKNEKIRLFSILSIASDANAEVLNLKGTSSQSGQWTIYAVDAAHPVGKAARMNPDKKSAPSVHVASGNSFCGFAIENVE